MLIPKTPTQMDRARRPGPRAPLERESTQRLEWPAALGWATRLAPVASAGLLVLGGWLLATSAGVEGLERPTAGLLAVTVAVALVAYVVVLQLCVARSVSFLRDRVVIAQTGREPVELAYASYQQDWVVDATNPRALRVLMFRDNRGCTILRPPTWVRDAFAEIARIHREEGWYEPDPRP